MNHKNKESGHTGLEFLVLMIPICLISIVFVLPLGIIIGRHWGYRASKQHVIATIIFWPVPLILSLFIGNYVLASLFFRSHLFVPLLITVGTICLLGSVLYFAWVPTFLGYCFKKKPILNLLFILGTMLFYLVVSIYLWLHPYFDITSIL